ncbi:hypothetical protein ACXR8U_21610 [Methylobacterium radiotolerans]|jgi:muramidase (phage lysozyme)|uniref:hypothetical protein n=1 Tax=Methylobacterium radiotolerans TaxID=31998 RepID=UPI00117FEE0E|nr:hypothetical protein [Methylobacterium radiotolerans]
MATVVDALVVTLGLDPAQFTKGQKDAAAALVKTRESATKEGKQIEKSIDNAGEAVERLARNALKLFAIFTAGRAIKDFIGDITNADSSLGRLAKSIGSTPEAISALGNAVARNGGSADAAAGSFQRLSDSINEMKVTGNSSALPAFARLQGLSGKQIRLNTDLLTTFGDLADAAKGTADRSGVPMATYLLKQAGVDQDTAALLIQGRAKLMESLRKSGQLGLVRQEDAEAAQRLQTSIKTLQQVSESFGRSIMTAVTPAIVDLIERFQKWLDANQDWIKSDLVESLKQFAKQLRELPWEETGKSIKAFAKGADDAAQSMGGWMKVCEALFLFWVGSKAASIVASILRVSGLLSGGPLGAVLKLALAASVASDLAVPNAEKPGVITRSDDENTGAAVPPSGGTRDPRIDRDRAAARDWADRQWNRVRRWGSSFLGGGEAQAAEGGEGIRTRGRRAARGDQSDGVAANPGAYKDVLDHIARSEGTAHRRGGGYNTSLANGLLLPGGKEQDLTKLTLDQIDALQTGMLRHPSNRWNSSAIGRYQVVRTTLRDQRAKLGLKGTDLYDEKTQDLIGANLARQTRGNAVALKNEWASLVGAKNAIAVELMRKVDPKSSVIPLERPPANTEGARKPDVLADPGDDRRKPLASVLYPAVPKAAQTGAASVVAQTASIAPDRAAVTTNDNRSTSTSTAEAHFHGDMVFNGVRDSGDVERNLRARLKEPQFIQAANYAQA